jgi:hypothetical protein
MAENADKQTSAVPSFDPSIQTENIAFDPAEMIACSCGRTNPPNRLKCMYCARELDIDIEKAGHIKTTSRKLELWERGFNVVFTGIVEEREVTATSIADHLSMDADHVDVLLSSGTPFPLAHVESEKEAALIGKNLEQLGIKTTVVGDTDLDAEKLPVRLSGMVIDSESLGLIAFNTGQTTHIPITDPLMLVHGVITSGQTNVLEKRGRGKDAKLIDETSTMADEAVLDIYAPGHSKGFRVRTAGFDFSCLGENKGLLAADNVKKLIASLLSHVPAAQLIDNYRSISNALESVWEVESKRSHTGFQRTSFAQRGFGSVTSTSNLNQFTKYSRLQWHIYETKG